MFACPSSLLTVILDNSGRIIVWDLGSREPLQTIDATFAGSVTSLCWINVGTADESPSESPSPAFAVGFGTGIIAIYKQSSENVRNFLLANAMLTAFCSTCLSL